MFLAIREIKKEKLRYGLILTVVVLISYLIFILSALALGLADADAVGAGIAGIAGATGATAAIGAAGLALAIGVAAVGAVAVVPVGAGAAELPVLDCLGDTAGAGFAEL